MLICLICVLMFGGSNVILFFSVIRWLNVNCLVGCGISML